MNEDLINGLFYLGAAAATSLNLWWFLRRREKGQQPAASLLMVGYFLAWNVFGLAYFAHLAQWWSMAGDGLLTAVNATWMQALVRKVR